MSDRIKWIDCAKGIAAILVLIGHFVSVTPLQVIIYSFHMPLFFFLSGVTFNDNSIKFKDFIKKKFRQIMVPYYIFVMPLFLLKGVQDIGEKNILLLLQHFAGIFLCWKGTAFYSGVWFLPCMFCVYIIAWGQKLPIKGCKYVVAVLLVCLGYILERYHIALPLGLDTALIGLLFFECGHMLKDKRELLNTKNIFLYGITALTAVLNFLICGHRIEMFSCDYGSFILFIISSFAGICATIALSKIMAENETLITMGKSATYLYGAQLVPFSFYGKLTLEGTATKIVVGILVVVLVTKILLYIEPKYVVLLRKCNQKT